MTVPLLNTILLLSSGSLFSHRWFIDNDVLYTFARCNILAFSTPKISRRKRIGPHNLDILSILIGSMLGDCCSEQRDGSTWFTFYQAASHKDYLLWLHSQVSSLGYCKLDLLMSRRGSQGSVRFVIRFRTFRFASFNWIHEAFYVNKIKVVPRMIGDYLTPLALAIWIIDDGGAVSSGLKLATNSFQLDQVEYLCTVLKNKYNLDARVEESKIIYYLHSEIQYDS